MLHEYAEKAQQSKIASLLCPDSIVFPCQQLYFHVLCCTYDRLSRMQVLNN